MKPAHVNYATFTGTVEKMFELECTGLGRPLLKFFLNTGNTAERTSTGDIAEIQRCIAVGETAQQFVKRVRPGATLLVEGPLRVNSRARRPLHQRIAKLYVQSATIVRPAPTALEILARTLAPEDKKRDDGRAHAKNELHLVGKVAAVEDDGVFPRVTLSTRLPFAATHDVQFLGDDLDSDVRVGVIAEVRGLLYHHIEHWDDGQIRLLSRVQSEDIKILDDTASASASSPVFTALGSTGPGEFRLN